jgi:hypothetical protein
MFGLIMTALVTTSTCIGHGALVTLKATHAMCHPQLAVLEASAMQSHLAVAETQVATQKYVQFTSRQSVQLGQPMEPNISGS